MKRTAAVFLVLMLTFFLPVPGILAEILPDTVSPGEYRVMDRADVLSASEEDQLEEAIALIRNTYDFDVVILTETSTDGKAVNVYAADYYDYGGFGCGENHDGIMLLLVTGGGVGNREYYIMNTGRSIEVFTDSVMYDMEDNFLPYLRASYYAAGMGQFVNDVQARLEAAEKEQSFLYRNAISFGMTLEEVEEQCEMMFLQDDSPFSSFADWYDDTHRVYTVHSDYIELDFVFLCEEDDSSLEEIIVAFIDVQGAYREMLGMDPEEEIVESIPDQAELAELDYEAIEEALCRKYGEGEAADGTISIILQSAMSEDEGFVLSHLVRRILPNGGDKLVIDHCLVYSPYADATIRVVCYRCLSPEAWAAYQYQQNAQSLDQFLEDML